MIDISMTIIWVALQDFIYFLANSQPSPRPVNAIQQMKEILNILKYCPFL